MSNRLHFKKDTLDVLKVPVDITDTSEVITIPVRTFDNRGDIYTVTACAYNKFPFEVFYRLRVQHRKESSKVEQTIDKDFKVLKRMIRREPIYADQYHEIKRKLHRKLVEKQLEKHTKESSEKTVAMTSSSIDTINQTLMEPSEILQDKTDEENVCKPDNTTMGNVMDSDTIECFKSSKFVDNQLLEKLQVLAGEYQRIIKTIQQKDPSFPKPSTFDEFQSANNNGEINKPSESAQWISYVIQACQKETPENANKLLRRTVAKLQKTVNDFDDFQEKERINDDEAHDTYSGHILGIYSRSTIHGNYKGCSDIEDQRL